MKILGHPCHRWTKVLNQEVQRLDGESEFPNNERLFVCKARYLRLELGRLKTWSAVQKLPMR